MRLTLEITGAQAMSMIKGTLIARPVERLVRQRRNQLPE